ncbi:MAG: O-antigen ligase family protein [Clostridia bacterium]|nr:O-antigen ligase family protein [Clostridia bacterium]
MRRNGIDSTGVLKVYDKVTGIFNEIFDSRLLTAAFFALIGYCTLFMQRKFPMRWMIFVLFGMILLGFVTMTARSGAKEGVRFHGGMAGLWMAAHGMMVVSGLFYQDWLSESVPLLIAYPIVFTVLASRDDESTFRSILRGTVFAVLPFVLWSVFAVPVTFGYPGYKGVFYDANTLSMSCIVMTTAASVLCYASAVKKRFASAAGYGACALLAAVMIVLTLSRSGLLALAGVMTVLAIALIAGTAKHPVRLLAILLCGLLVLGGAGLAITMDKMVQATQEDYDMEVAAAQARGEDTSLIPLPQERGITMDDLTSDRWGIWVAIMENLTWNGHETSVVAEWVAKDGTGERHFNAHNAFMGVTYNNGFIAGLLMVAYTLLACVRAAKYYWIHRKTSAYAATPLAFCAVFILVGMFESVYAPFSVIGCTYLLVQAPLWRAEL